MNFFSLNVDVRRLNILQPERVTKEELKRKLFYVQRVPLRNPEVVKAQAFGRLSMKIGKIGTKFEIFF